MAYYKDLREHLKALEERNKLVRITREVNKDTQLHPLVRLQFRGLPEEERKGFLFENVVDSRGRRYDTPVAVSVLAASREVYAIGMGCKPEEVGEKWLEAQRHPIKPKVIADGPVHDEIHIGEKLLEHGGLDEFPIPISTPGYDAGPFFTSPYWVTKDPDTGVANVGTYRAHVKSQLRTGILTTLPQHSSIHLAKCRERGINLQAAIIVGASPNIGYVSASKLPYETSEYDYAGGIAGEPVELVRCKTVDLEVPAYAEIVVEGELSTRELEPEAPFGEAMGLMGRRGQMPYFTVRCITHRKRPIWQSFLSQYPPSESSKLREVAYGYILLKHLKDDLNIPHVIEVAMHESCGGPGFTVIRMNKAEQSEIWRALEGASESIGNPGKILIAVDEDINPWDPDAVHQACYSRFQPHRDIRVKRYSTSMPLDYSVSDPSEVERKGPEHVSRAKYSHLLINATMKWAYPPISLPKREFMEDALRLWKEENLPPLHLKEPWYGYSLGLWSDEEEEHAMLSAKGEYYRVGEILAKRRQKVE